MALTRFFIPTKGNNGQRINYKQLLKDIVSQHCIYFGGASIYPAIWISMNKQGRLIREKVYFVESYSTIRNIQRYKKSITELALKIKKELN